MPLKDTNERSCSCIQIPSTLVRKFNAVTIKLLAIFSVKLTKKLTQTGDKNRHSDENDLKAEQINQ